MKKKVISIFILSNLVLFNVSFGQENNNSKASKKIAALFSSQDKLDVKFNYSSKDLKKNTNDSTYITTTFSYSENKGQWKTLDIDLRARGNFRRRSCYFTPTKLKVKKGLVKGTLFEGSRKLKVVLPCLQETDKNDNILKEFIAYKLFEVVSPYYFKTRLINIEFEEIRGKRTKTHFLTGFFIEDDDKVATRSDGQVMKRPVHPLQQEALSSVRNAFFQFMIGNTDFSTGFQHNQKLLFIDKRATPLPYDFDMSGFVNTSYAVVSVVQATPLDITEVTERKYRGFKRDPVIYKQVRQEFIDNKSVMLQIIDSYKSKFDSYTEFVTAKDFIESFFKIIENNNRYKNYILDQARTK